MIGLPIKRRFLIRLSHIFTKRKNQIIDSICNIYIYIFKILLDPANESLINLFDIVEEQFLNQE